GVFRIPYRQFVPAMIVGSTIYIAIFIGIGMWGGPVALSAFRSHGLPLRFVFTTVLLLATTIALWWLNRRAREAVIPAHRLAPPWRRRLANAFIAGFGASAIMGLVSTWILECIGVFAGAPPERAFLQFLEGYSTPVIAAAVTESAPTWLIITGLTATIPFQFVSHVVWAILYALVFEPRTSGSTLTRGLKFAVLPWFFSGLLLFPFVGAGPFGYGLAGPLTILSDFVQNLVFGVTLAALYRLIRLARQPRVHISHRHGHRHQVGVTPATPSPLVDPIPLSSVNGTTRHAVHDAPPLQGLDSEAPQTRATP
ncbi:MAG TPA: hypothetical protein VGW38_15440, partial [Chloroflexota bacterium]|nr:hypothetical protein [Chloroflexota bacterium]